jgi:hypothetical protein
MKLSKKGKKGDKELRYSYAHNNLRTYIYVLP